MPTPTSDGERLYIIDDRGIALSLRVRDGSTVWDRTRIEPGTYSASPVLADGKIYATSEEGTTTVLKAGRRLRDPGSEPAGRLHAGIACGGWQSDLHPHGRVPILHRQELKLVTRLRSQRPD